MAVSRIMMGIVASVIAAPGALAQQQEAGPKPIPRAQFIASMDADFRKMDADKNGQVTRAEIEQVERVRAEISATARNRAQFAELDTNRNGQLSPAEFAKLTPPANVNAAPALARMDTNRDQRISLVEYRAATVANFDRLDTDRNGVVTPAEAKAGGVTSR
jgi:Ca2+-binding EF-hand superfamily protein